MARSSLGAAVSVLKLHPTEATITVRAQNSARLNQSASRLRSVPPQAGLPARDNAGGKAKRRLLGAARRPVQGDAGRQRSAAGQAMRLDRFINVPWLLSSW